MMRVKIFGTDHYLKERYEPITLIFFGKLCFDAVAGLLGEFTPRRLFVASPVLFGYSFFGVALGLPLVVVTYFTIWPGMDLTVVQQPCSKTGIGDI